MPELTSLVDSSRAGSRRLPLWVKGIFPLLLLVGVVFAVMRVGPAGVATGGIPPIEDLSIQRVAFPRPGLIVVSVVNGGPAATTLAQVMVDEALWNHRIDGDRTIARLGSRRIEIPYPWVEGEPLHITLVSSTGLTFTHEVEVAVRSPSADARFFATFALIGVYVGVVPIFIGLLWLPFMRGVDRKWVDFFLALTVGLLLFLGADALAESLETSSAVSSAFQGVGLVLLGVIGAPLLINVASRVGRKEGEAGSTPFYVATLIALGIGLHNLGEGLAIGTAYATGSVALGAFLVIGFMIHNTTEGLGIVAPLGHERPSVGFLARLGLLAGLPTVAGAWIGGLTHSPALITLFFALGAGAVVQVIWELIKLFRRRGDRGLLHPLNAVGLLAGLLLMYLTGLLIPA